MDLIEEQNIGVSLLQRSARWQRWQRELVRPYYIYLRLERGLSPNTLDAYMRDLDKLLSFLAAEDVEPLQMTIEQLHAFAAGLFDIGLDARSQSRILSGVRAFCRFLIMTGRIDSDPSELLVSPKLGIHLPEVLSVEEIDALIAAIRLDAKEGQRNRAMIEVLYSCGLRVSELCNLKISDLYLEEGFIKVKGKGSKERLVPISPKAIKELHLYFLDRNQWQIPPEYQDFVFITVRRGTRNIGRIMVFHLIKELAAKAGIKKNISPHTLRHSLKAGLTCVPFRPCLAMRALLPPRSIPTSTGHDCVRRYFSTTRVICTMAARAAIKIITLKRIQIWKHIRGLLLASKC